MQLDISQTNISRNNINESIRGIFLFTLIMLVTLITMLVQQRSHCSEADLEGYSKMITGYDHSYLS